MKNYFFMLSLTVAFVFFGCKGNKTSTTSLTTNGKVQNQQSEMLQGIAIVTNIIGFDYVDTVYTNEKGEFRSRVDNVPYPIPAVTVTAIDPKGIYQKQSISPNYMFECGTEFVPEKNVAFTEKEIIFTLKK